MTNLARALPTLLIALLASAASAQGNATRFKPEQIVEAKDGSLNVACLTSDSLDQLIKHMAAGELTKANAMSPIPCTSIPVGGRYKLLSVKGDRVEFIHPDNKGAVGLWAVIEAFQPIPAK